MCLHPPSFRMREPQVGHSLVSAIHESVTIPDTWSVSLVLFLELTRVLFLVVFEQQLVLESLSEELSLDELSPLSLDELLPGHK